MTTETQPKVLNGTITDLAFKYSGKGEEFAEVSINTGGQYPVKCRAFDEELVQRFHKAQKGVEIGLLIEETQGEYQGKPITYRNIVGIQAANAQPSSPPTPKPQASGQRGQASPDREHSIERQVIFKAAIELIGSGTPEDEAAGIALRTWARVNGEEA